MRELSDIVVLQYIHDIKLLVYCLIYGQYKLVKLGYLLLILVMITIQKLILL